MSEMPEDFTAYEIQENEWLLQIARKPEYGFRDEKAIADVNPDLIAEVDGNTDALPKRRKIKIPRKNLKSVGAKVNQTNVYQAADPRRELRILLQLIKAFTDKGGAVPDVIVTVNDTTEHVHESIPTVDLPDIVRAAELTVTTLGSGKKTQHQTITLHVGGLDPIVGPGAARAIQKILTNFGFYDGPIDGVLGASTRVALRAFQQVMRLVPENAGMADDRTCSALAAECGIAIGHKAAEAMPSVLSDRDQVLGGDIEVGVSGSDNVFWDSRYNEPTASDRTKRQPVGPFRFLPKVAYVAPGRTNMVYRDYNTLKSPSRRFIFLDTGRWLNEARDFGLVWGRHAYLCRYHADQPRPAVIAPKQTSRLDELFFEALGGRVEVASVASAVWAPEKDFDWDQLTIIVPDLHLLTTRLEIPWRGKNCLVSSELDLLRFAEDLTDVASTGGLQSKLRFIQIGDSFDLWVGRFPRLFRENTSHTVELRTPEEMKFLAGGLAYAGLDPVAQLRSWIDDIRGLTLPEFEDRAGLDGVISRKLVRPWNWVREAFHQRELAGMHTPAEMAKLAGMLEVRNHGFDPSYTVWMNPAVRAMEILEKALGEDGPGDPNGKPASGTVYIYGNHDNYLGLPDVCRAVGLAPRRRYFEAPGLWVEHAQRMEDLFPTGANYDGAVAGYDLTKMIYDLRVGQAEPGHYHKIQQGAANMGDAAAETYASLHDQPGYWNEFAKIRVGREVGESLQPPHIFVIGHTHQPLLRYIDINRR